jgi:hypothetical protein
MKLKIFKRSRKQKPKPVHLRLFLKRPAVRLAVCNSKGKVVTDLLLFNLDKKGVKTCQGACFMLEEKGYDTSFCDWNDGGGMLFFDVHENK